MNVKKNVTKVEHVVLTIQLKIENGKTSSVNFLINSFSHKTTDKLVQQELKNISKIMDSITTAK